MSVYRFTLLSLVSLINILSAQEAQKGQTRETIQERKVAIYLIHFKDTPSKHFSGSNSIYPSKSKILKLLNGPDIQNFWSSNSWGQFKTKADVFGYIQHPGNTPTGSAATTAYNDALKTLNLQIKDKGYKVNDYDTHVFLFFNSLNPKWTPGARFNSTTVKINNKVYKKLPVITHGGYIAKSGSHALSQKVAYGIFNQKGKWQEGKQDYLLSKFQRTYLHEFAHSLGLKWHEDFASNGAKPAWQASSEEHQLNKEYGNIFALLGKSSFSMNMSPASRAYLGWTNKKNCYTITKPGKHRVTVQPFNSNTGYRVVEIRVPYKYHIPTGFGYKNQGYMLTVIKDDSWSNLKHPAVSENTKGLLIFDVDGGGSRLLDASPSPLILAPFSRKMMLIDYRDLALKPGMVYKNYELALSNVRKNSDGSFSLDIELYKNAGRSYLALQSQKEFQKKYQIDLAKKPERLKDQDRDGISNILEYALGSDPKEKNDIADLFHLQKSKLGRETMFEVGFHISQAAAKTLKLKVEGSIDKRKWTDKAFSKKTEVIAHKFNPGKSSPQDWLQIKACKFTAKLRSNKKIYWRIVSQDGTLYQSK